MRSAREEFFSGIQAELPILVGVIPFGLIYGVLALSSGIPPGQAQAMSSIVFAGSSQFIAAQLVGNGTPAIVIVLTIAVVNLRHALYSASMAPHLQKLRGVWKWALAYLLTDEAYAVSIINYQREGPSPNRHWYLLGAGLALWSTWQASTAAGILIGTQMPTGWSLEFTLTLTFMALVMPAIKDRPSVVAALSAGVIALLGHGLPYKLGLLIAAVTGIGLGLWMESRK